MIQVTRWGRLVLLATTALGALTQTDATMAQSASGAQTSDELIVYGTIIQANRADTTAPVLAYDLEYFQRFEPISLGDALKRAPGVSFTSDVLEYDQVQLCGLPAIYTQMQVNGQALTGGGNDRVFFADRIPAELIDNVEIIRSPSADMSSEGIAGTVNTNLKRAGQITGGWVRGSGFGVVDDELRGAGSVGYGNTIGGTSYLFSVDVQQRRNPKEKETSVFNADGELEEFGTQKDTRDGTDYAFHGDVLTKVGEGSLRLYGFYVMTDRKETEFTDTFNFEDAERTIETQLEDIKQNNLSVAAEYKLPVKQDEFQFLIGYNRFRDDLNTLEHEGETPSDLEVSQRESIDTTDQDWFSTLAYTAQLNDLLAVKYGVDGRIKTRDFRQVVIDDEGEDDSPANGVFDVREERVDPYVKATLKAIPGLTIETGLRYEFTHRKLEGTDGDAVTDSTGQLNPSLHLKYAATDTTTLKFSVARMVRRPSFDILVPADLSDEPDDDDITVGNPNLKQETAWGIDVGIDQKIGEKGLVGVNYFNRDIKDKIELVATGALTEDGGRFFTYENFAEGRSYGVEFDVSLPLTVLGLPNTSVFGNYTWLESEVTDPVTGDKRPFRDQPDYIFNIGFIHNIPEWNSSFGASYQKRGPSLAFDFAEIVETSYDGNLEAFIEKRVSESLVIRLTGANLLDAEKLENLQAFDPDLNGDFDGREIEKEKSGPLVLLSVRKSF
jgi:outer membrane receptor for ferrienterochelin and colicins